MISWFAVSGCYFSGLAIAIAFPIVLLVLKKKGVLYDLSENWLAFIYALTTSFLFVTTMLFVLQDFGIQEKVDQRAAKQIAELKQRYEELYQQENEVLKAEKEIYKQIILEALKDYKENKKNGG